MPGALLILRFARKYVPPPLVAKLALTLVMRIAVAAVVRLPALFGHYRLRHHHGHKTDDRFSGSAICDEPLPA